MGRTKSKKICLRCGESRPIKDFYKSYSKLHHDGKIPYCKQCLLEMVNEDDLETVKDVLRKIDRPFIYRLWEASKKELIKVNKKEEGMIFGIYMKNLALPQYRKLTWADSEFDSKKEYKSKTKKNKKKVLSDEEIARLEDKWGYGFSPEELQYFERKYNSLKANYPVNTSLHEEHLKAYCIYKVKAELATAKGNVKDAKEWASLAQKQGEIAKINLNKLTKSDLSQGLDCFSELARMVEKTVDIIPILPKFIERPQDKVDFTIWQYVNYERGLRGLPEVTYDEIYKFYQDKIKEYKNKKGYEFLIKEVEITDSNGIKKKILTLDVNDIIKQKQKEQPNDEFIKNLDKWVELVAFYRWFPDLWYDLITPEAGNIRLDLDQRVLLRCLARFPTVYGVFPRGYGKCVAHDTILFTTEGMKEIGEYFNYSKSEKEFYTNHNIPLLNRYGEIEMSNKGVHNGYKPTKKFKTEEGYEIETTLVHPLLVMTKNGELKYKKATEIEVGDYVSISRKNNVWGNKTKLNIDMDSWLNSFNNYSKWKIEKVKCNIIQELDEQLALVMGHLVGNGTLTRDNIIMLTTKDEEILNNFKYLFEKRLGLKVKQKTAIDYVIHSKYAREYFNQLGLKQANAFNKEIPKTILEAPKNIVASFVRGLFDTDGGISNSYIEFCTASEKLAKQLQIVLLNFGIVSKREKKYNKRFKTYAYRITIYDKNMDIFLKEIGFSVKRKQEKLIELCNKKRNSNKDVIPYQKEKIQEFFQDAKKYNKYLYDKLYHVLKDNNQLTYEKLEMLLNLNNVEKCKNYQYLLELYNLNYFYSKIKSIEDSENYVCDLQMPKTHSFIANGFINHNTLLELMYNYHTCIFYPDIEISLTAQTRENASKLVSEKHREIIKFYPLIKNELTREPKFSKDIAEVYFKSGGKLDILANQQSTKGARRKRLTIEESAQLNNELFQDVLEPIVNIPRRTIGKMALINPVELNGQINFFTTSWYRGTDEYERNISLADDMVNLKGTMVLGAGWELACEYGRGEPKSKILEKKEKLSPVFFALNYESKWVGSTDGALISMKKVMDLRTLTKAELKGNNKDEYILAVDVARSESTSNNQCSIAVLKIKRNKMGKIKKIQLVNLISVSSILNFKTQAIEIMKIRNRYNAKAVVIDGNGLGKGLIDQLVLEQFDPVTGESLGCYKVMNTEQTSELIDAEEILYDLKAQSNNSEVIVNFIDMVESKKLELLEKRHHNYLNSEKEYVEKDLLPFVETDLLLEEIANLKLKQLPSGKFTLERNTRKINKDRYSALAYGLWYIKNFEEEDIIINENTKTIDWLLIN